MCLGGSTRREVSVGSWEGGGKSWKKRRKREESVKMRWRKRRSGREGRSRSRSRDINSAKKTRSPSRNARRRGAEVREDELGRISCLTGSCTVSRSMLRFCGRKQIRVRSSLAFFRMSYTLTYCRLFCEEATRIEPSIPSGNLSLTRKV